MSQSVRYHLFVIVNEGAFFIYMNPHGCNAKDKVWFCAFYIHNTIVSQISTVKLPAKVNKLSLSNFISIRELWFECFHCNEPIFYFHLCLNFSSFWLDLHEFALSNFRPFINIFCMKLFLKREIKAQALVTKIIPSCVWIVERRSFLYYT